MKKLLTIFCWSGDNERIERHWPYWERSEADILLVYPVDAPCNRPGIAAFKSQQFGPELIRRILFGMDMASRMEYDAYAFTEADSICLKMMPDHYGGISGYIFHNDDPRFHAKTFMHWPWMFTRPWLKSFVAKAKSFDPAAEEGFPDRFISFVIESCHIPVREEDNAFSRNQFDTEALMQEARMAVKRGVWHLHGVKTEQQLKDLLA